MSGANPKTVRKPNDDAARLRAAKAEAAALRKAMSKIRDVLGKVGALSLPEVQRAVLGIVASALASSARLPRPKRGPNRVGCRVSGDVCAEHDSPLECRHGCDEAVAHACQSMGDPRRPT